MCMLSGGELQFWTAFTNQISVPKTSAHPGFATPSGVRMVICPGPKRVGRSRRENRGSLVTAAGTSSEATPEIPGYVSLGKEKNVQVSNRLK